MTPLRTPDNRSYLLSSRPGWRPAIVALLLAASLAPPHAFAETGIALGKNSSGAWMIGVARGAGSGEATKSAALADCATRGGACAHVETFAKGCVAVAGAKDGPAFGVGRGDDDAPARQDALASCAQRGNDCALVASVCDEGRSPPPAGGDLAKALQAWQSCFRPEGGAPGAAKIAACESAASYDGLGRMESMRLERRRSKLLGADVEKRPIGEKAPEPR